MINFILSFDYELAWGSFDKINASYLTENVINSNEAASRLLQINEQMEVPATWAIVGLMLPSALGHKDKLDLLDAKFQKSVLASDVFSEIDEQAASALLEMPTGFFAKVIDSPSQEFASHTFSHLYALEVDDDAMSNDFKYMAEVCAENKVGRPSSLVMPKNQVTEVAIACAAESGVKIIRVNPNNWLYSTREHGRIEAKVIRLLRFLDAFLPVSELFVTKSQVLGTGCTEGNFFFRPDVGIGALDYIHYLRFKLMLHICRWRKRDLHMWSHPHNFGRDINRSLRNYVRALTYVLKLKSAGKIEMKNMGHLID